MFRFALAVAVLAAIGLMIARSRMELRAMQGSTPARQDEASPPELGCVRWRRDWDKGKADAAASGKPLLVLFQEVPG